MRVRRTAPSKASQAFKVRRIDDATPATDTDQMDGHFMDAVVDAHRTVRDHRSHHLADQPPRHRVGVAIDLDGTIGLHTPDQFTRGLEGRQPTDGLALRRS
jgi:hypothetical protein